MSISYHHCCVLSVFGRFCQCDAVFINFFNHF